MESYYCIYCNEEVTARQEALLCDGCDKWQHRRCNTGISRQQYRDAVKSGLEVVWRCLCKASPACVCPDGQQERKRLQEGINHCLVIN